LGYSRYNLYFGDLHCHSNLSLCGVCAGRDLSERDAYVHVSLIDEYRELSGTDPAESVDRLYEFARDEAGLDFAAVTDHDFSMTDEVWALIRRKASEWYSPGRFVTLSAYEWTSAAYGHRNVYFLTDDGPLLRCVDYGRSPIQERGRSPRELWNALERHGAPAITVPHHPPITQFPVDWSFHDPRFDRVVEVVSLWGVFEYYGNPFECVTSDVLPRRHALDALERGYKLGFVGGSDSHDCRPGARTYAVVVRNAREGARLNSLSRGFTRYFFNNPLSPYLTAVYAEELTREAVFEALRSRRCYAVVGARIRLELEIDGRLMGEEVVVDDPEHRPTVRVSAEGEGELDRVELVKNGRVVFRRLCKGRAVEFEWVDEGEVERGYNYYYVRAFQRDGARAWSSPVWVTYRNLGRLEARVEGGALVLRNVGLSSLKRVRIAAVRRSAVERREPDALRRQPVGAFVWVERLVDAVMLRLRFKGEEPTNFRGSLRLRGFEGYTVSTVNFTVVKYGGDLVADDYRGSLEWDITTSSHLNPLDAASVKGLDVLVKVDPFSSAEAVVEVWVDGRLDPRRTFLGERPVAEVPFTVRLSEPECWLEPLTAVALLPPGSEIKLLLPHRVRGVLAYPAATGYFGPRARLIRLGPLRS